MPCIKPLRRTKCTIPSRYHIVFERRFSDPTVLYGTERFCIVIDDVNCFRTIMSYEDCDACDDTGGCPRPLYFSNPVTTYNGHIVGSMNQNNIDSINHWVDYLIEDNEVPLGQGRSIELCDSSPCEATPLEVSELINGNGMVPFSPYNNMISQLNIPAGLMVTTYTESDYFGVGKTFFNCF